MKLAYRHVAIGRPIQLIRRITRFLISVMSSIAKGFKKVADAMLAYGVV